MHCRRWLPGGGQLTLKYESFYIYIKRIKKLHPFSGGGKEAVGATSVKGLQPWREVFPPGPVKGPVHSVKGG
jgi:hypothetical protein